MQMDAILCSALDDGLAKQRDDTSCGRCKMLDHDSHWFEQGCALIKPVSVNYLPLSKNLYITLQVLFINNKLKKVVNYENCSCL